jgi:hypothetical protein
LDVYDYYITPEEYEIAAQNGISRKLLNQRIRQSGWDKERAITTPPKKQTNLKRWMEIAEKNGIPYYTARNRVVLCGWSWERAVTEPIWTTERLRERMKKQNLNKRKYPKKYLELAKRNGIKIKTFHTRVRYYGWDLERAATVRPMKYG